MNIAVEFDCIKLDVQCTDDGSVNSEHGGNNTSQDKQQQVLS